MKIDPVLLEILNNKVTSVTEESGFTIKRIGHTLYVKETSDFGTALADLNGKFFAYPNAVGVSGFVDLDCGPTIRAVPNIGEGDVILTNHSYASEGLATHSPDLHIIVPYFYQGTLVCYGWSFLHSTDVGGRVPGSVSPSSSEIFQEGLLIAPTKLCIAGEFNPDVMMMLNNNSRTPAPNFGDLKAMIAAHTIGQRRICDIIEQHGLQTFLDCQEDLIEYSAAKARDVLRKLPDGIYEFWDYMDDDLVTQIPLRIRIRMTVQDGTIEMDFTGTDPQTAAAFNIPTMGRRHAWLTLRLMAFICTYDPTIPLNSGIFHSITAKMPQGCLVNPQFPAAVGVRHASAMRVTDVVTGALFQAVPEMMLGCTGGVVIPVVLAEPVTNTGKRNVLVVQSMIGGMGGRLGIDGVDGRGSGLSNMQNNPLETVEANAAVVIRQYALRPDSGGPGKWRGGAGLALTFEVLIDGCSVLGRGMERFRFSPWGVAGGEPGAPARTIVNQGRPDEHDIGKIDMVRLRRGDTITVLTPGGGGYGNPFTRDPASVLQDVTRGLVSIEAARRGYGVAIVDGAVNAGETEKLRHGRAEGASAMFHFDANRMAWDSICDDETLTEFTRKLQAYPASQRGDIRRDLFLRIFPELEQPGFRPAEFADDIAGRRTRFRAALAEF